MTAPLSPSDSLELESLASSSGGPSRADSVRNDNDSVTSNGNISRRSSLNEQDFPYYNEDVNDDDDRNQLLSASQAREGGRTRHGRSHSSISSISDLIFTLPASRDLLNEIEIPLEKQKQLTWFDGLSLVIGMQVGYVLFCFIV